MKTSFEEINRVYFILIVFSITVILGVVATTRFAIPLVILLLSLLFIGWASKYNPSFLLSIVIFLCFAGGSLPWYLMGLNENRSLIIFSINLLIFISAIFFKKIQLNKYNLILIFIIFMMMLLFYLTTLYSLDQPYGQYKIEYIFAWAFFPSIIILAMWKLPKDKHIIYLLILTGLIELFNLYYHLDELMMGRLAYGDANPIWIARSIGFTALGFLILYIKKQKSYFLLFSIICLLLMTLTGSKGPIFSVILAAVYFLIKSKAIKNIMPMVFAGVILLVFLTFINVDNYDISRVFEVSGDSASVTERLRIFELGFAAWSDSPILGQGLGGYSAFIGEIGTRTYPHNMIVEIISEMGLIGLFIIVFIVCSIIYSLKKIRNIKEKTNLDKSSLYLYFTIFLYVFCNAMFSGDVGQNTEVWISLFLLIMFSIIANNSSNKQKNIQEYN